MGARSKSRRARVPIPNQANHRSPPPVPPPVASPPVAGGTFSGVSVLDVASTPSGTATATLLANTKSGSFSVTVTVLSGGVPTATTLTFTVTNTPGPPTQLTGPAGTVGVT